MKPAECQKKPPASSSPPPNVHPQVSCLEFEACDARTVIALDGPKQEFRISPDSPSRSPETDSPNRAIGNTPTVHPRGLTADLAAPPIGHLASMEDFRSSRRRACTRARVRTHWRNPHRQAVPVLQHTTPHHTGALLRPSSPVPNPRFPCPKLQAPSPARPAPAPPSLPPHTIRTTQCTTHHSVPSGGVLYPPGARARSCYTRSVPATSLGPSGELAPSARICICVFLLRCRPHGTARRCRRASASGLWTLDTGHWTLDIEYWMSDFETLTVGPGSSDPCESPSSSAGAARHHHKLVGDSRTRYERSATRALVSGGHPRWQRRCA
ncbi:hypothetical protein DENSPDRAFT_618483 [Dentipellis sp. KUC8613]|nr:hypothetical protein DENSPDRAFT_618483 [Dentipellis sp. KUC8613]